MIRDFVRQWWNKAESDLAAADILVQSEMVDYHACTFHCQQASEKFVKAYLVRHQIEFRKIHDLAVLLQLVGQENPKLQERLEPYTWLTPYGVTFRYPGEPAVNRDTAEDAVQAAKRVKDAIVEHLESYLDG